MAPSLLQLEHYTSVYESVYLDGQMVENCNTLLGTLLFTLDEPYDTDCNDLTDTF